MQITSHFKLSEFHCKNGAQYPLEWINRRLKPLCEALERIRSEFGGAAITINSGYRTKEYNKQIGGAKNSQHCEGNAVDFKVENVDARTVYAVLEKLIEKRAIPDGGLGSYKTWTHYDLRGHRARWRE